MVASAGFADLAGQRKGTAGMGTLSTLHPEPGERDGAGNGAGSVVSCGLSFGWSQSHL